MLLPTYATTTKPVVRFTASAGLRLLCAAAVLAVVSAPSLLHAAQQQTYNDSGWAVSPQPSIQQGRLLGPGSINLDRVVTPELLRDLKVQDKPDRADTLDWRKARLARRSTAKRLSKPLKPLKALPAEPAPEELTPDSLEGTFEISDLPQADVVPETQALPEEPVSRAPGQSARDPRWQQHRPAPFAAGNAAPISKNRGADADTAEQPQSPAPSQDPVEITLPKEEAPKSKREPHPEPQSTKANNADSGDKGATDKKRSAADGPVAKQTPKPAAKQSPKAKRQPPKAAEQAEQNNKPTKKAAETPKRVEKPKRELKPLSRGQQSLRRRIRSVLSFYYRRPLNSSDHDSWEVMHSMLSYGLHSRVQPNGRRSKPVTAVGHLCFNRPCKRYKMLYITPEDRLDVRVGVGMQGHKGQLLAMLAQCNVSPDYPIKVQGKDFTIRDLIAAEQHTCFARTELSFKLIGLMHYLPSDATWVNDQGESWDIPKLIADERTQKIRGAACGGTHRLGGLALAVRKRVSRGEPLDGEWLEARKMVEQYQQYAFRLQNRDGSLSTEWFRGRGAEPDVDRRIRTTGHLLEWLIYSLPDEELVENQRVYSAVNYLTNLISSNTYNGWEIGPLCHALHALLLYDQRVFQPHDDFEAPQVARGRTRRPSKPSYLNLDSPVRESYYYVEARHEEREERENSPFGGLFGRRPGAERR